jgi:hypothetical protein
MAFGPARKAAAPGPDADRNAVIIAPRAADRLRRMPSAAFARASQTYKSLPSVGTVTVHDPFTGEAKPYVMPAGGRGYTRPLRSSRSGPPRPSC